MQNKVLYFAILQNLTVLQFTQIHVTTKLPCLFMALVVVSALSGYAWPPYFSGSVRCCSQAETLWRGHILKPWFFGRLDVLLPLKPNKSFSGFFFGETTGVLRFFFQGEGFIPFQTIFFLVIFLGGWQQHCHLKCPVTVRLVEKSEILSR